MRPVTGLKLRSLFRADHVGSILRPAALYDMRRDYERGLYTTEELRKTEDAAIEQVVRLQKTMNLRSFTDGELRRAMFFDGVFERLEGMTFMPSRPISEFKARRLIVPLSYAIQTYIPQSYIPHIKMMMGMGIKESPTIFCNGKIKRSSPFYVDHFKFMKSIVTPEDVSRIKVTMCSPSWFHQRHGSDLTYDLSVYKNDDQYFDDLGVAYREEIQELYDLGCRFIQIDDPTFCYFCDEGMLMGMKEAGVDHEALLDTYIRAINVITKNRPDDLEVAVHMCRGNFKGGVWFSQGGYAPIAKKVFRELDVDTFYLEYDTERAGDFAPLKHMPLNKTVVLGLVTTKNGKLEAVESLEKRVNEAAEVLMNGMPKRSREAAFDQLCISTQCGFASVWEGNPITEEDQKAKLALLGEAARRIWRL